jgi:hypothetical protein
MELHMAWECTPRPIEITCQIIYELEAEENEVKLETEKYLQHDKDCKDNAANGRPCPKES